MTAVLVVALVGSGVAAAYLVAAPKPHQGYTEFYVLGNDTAGPDATEYPRNFTAGEERQLVVGVENHHRSTRAYTVVVGVQRVRIDDAGAGEAGVEVLEERELERFRARVAPGERWTTGAALAPTLTGEVRLVFRLYPGDAATGEPLHELHLWIDVSAPDGDVGDTEVVRADGAVAGTGGDVGRMVSPVSSERPPGGIGDA